MLNANGDPARFAPFGLPVVADSVPDFAGPLAGILAGLDWVAANRPGIEWVVSVPGDCPFLPRDLVARLHEARIAEGKPLACAHSGDWRHPVVGLWQVALREDLRRALTVEDLRKIEVWTARHGVALADWPAEPVDPFFNVNTPEDVARRATRAAQRLPRESRLARPSTEYGRKPIVAPGAISVTSSASSASPSVAVSDEITPAPSCGCLVRLVGAVRAPRQRDAHIFAPALLLAIGKARRDRQRDQRLGRARRRAAAAAAAPRARR